MRLEKNSPCKVNLLLNILGKRGDGFHELETIFQPVPLHDRLIFSAANEIRLTCNHPELPTDSKNLVWRAADAFLKASGRTDGVQIHLEKNLPLAAGLGGGSANAAVTLLALNELSGNPLSAEQLHKIASSLGSDVPFFLQDKPALATGRGEKIEALDFFPALNGTYIFLIHPGFGISTPWAYQQLANFPEALNGRRGRAQEMVSVLQTGNLEAAGKHFYNSLEAPALKKFPLLALFQEFFRENGSPTLMSGSGSTTFAIIPGKARAENLAEQFKSKFGEKHWTALLPLS